MKVTKKSLDGNGASYGAGWVSNGHWAIRLDQVDNAAIFSGEPEAVAAAFGIKHDNGRYSFSRWQNSDAIDRVLSRISDSEPYRVSAMVCDAEINYASRGSYRGQSVPFRLAVSASGSVTALAQPYCELLGISGGMAIYSAGAECAAFVVRADHDRDTDGKPQPEDVIAVLMPLRLDREAIAKSIGAPLLSALLAALPVMPASLPSVDRGSWEPMPAEAVAIAG